MCKVDWSKGFTILLGTTILATFIVLVATATAPESMIGRLGVGREAWLLGAHCLAWALGGVVSSRSDGEVLDINSDDPHVRVRATARTAALALDFATRRGDEIPADVAVRVTEFEALVRDRMPTQEEQTTFRKQFQALIKILSPVKIESIHEITAKDVRPWIWFVLPLFWRPRISHVKQSVLNYQVLSWVTLLTLVFTQAWALSGKAALDSIAALERQHDELQDRMLALPTVSTTATMAALAKIPTIDQFSDKGGIASAALLTAEKGPAPKKEKPVLDTASQQAELDLRIQRVGRQIQANYETLDNLLQLRLTKLVNASAESASIANTDHLAKAVRSQMMALAIQVIPLYILPLLYGCLGACVYVLRQLSRDIHAMRFSENSKLRYTLRTTLGPLAGLAIAWISTPDSAGGTASFKGLTPLGLAFIAGYSVELLFSALDRFVEAFTSPPSPPVEQGDAAQKRPAAPEPRPLQEPPAAT